MVNADRLKRRGEAGDALLRQGDLETWWPTTCEWDVTRDVQQAVQDGWRQPSWLLCNKLKQAHVSEGLHYFNGWAEDNYKIPGLGPRLVVTTG